MIADLRHNLGFKPANAADLDWLIGLRITTMTRYLEESGEFLSLEDQRDRVLYDFADLRLVTLDDEPIGMIKVARTSESWKLTQIQLLPAYQDLGIGARLIEEVVAGARREKLPVMLSVLKVNPAQRLYERLGFVVVNATERSYEMRADP
ncbi:MAG: GNAT family N-acetyltransferase [Roseiflexaceae bacterium]